MKMDAYMGLWVRRGGILVPKPIPETPVNGPVSDEQPPPATPQRLEGFEALTIEVAARAASDETLKKAHSRWNRGIRDDKTGAFNREWERRNRQRQRARLASNNREDSPQ